MRQYVILALIFFAVFGTRLYFSLQSPYFTYDGYFSERQVTNIMQTGLPSFNHLSYSEHFFLPTFQYILAGLSYLVPFALKAVPAFFASLAVIGAYLLALQLTGNRAASLCSAFIAGFTPFYFSETLNSISVYTLVIPLFLFLLYFFLRLKERHFILLFVAGVILLAFTDASAIILVLGLLLYLALAKAENIEHSRLETELIIFSAIFVAWLVFIIFRMPLLKYGLSAVWQNLPPEIISQRFTSLSPIKAIYSIGILPFLAGVFVIYRYMLRQKVKQIYLLMSFAIVIFLLLWLQFVEAKVGLFFLGAILAVLFSQFYALFSAYLDKTKAAGFKVPILAVLMLALASSLIIPSFTAASQAQDIPSKELMAAMEWIVNNTENGSVVLAPLEYGHLIAAVAQRQNVLDSNFIFAKDAGQRFIDLNAIYSGSQETEGVRLLSSYYVAYIIPVWEKGAVKPAYLETDKDCFRQVYYPFPRVYKSMCDVS
ncbi:MAG: hypothetical protein V1702_01395 [Candidatus Woesearchaeota archaeon]